MSVWSVATAECLWQIPAHRGWIRAVTFTSDGQTLATAGDDHTIRLWDASSGTQLCSLGGRGAPMTAVAFSAEGKTITALGDDGSARLWRMVPPSCERQENHPVGVLTQDAPLTQDTARNLWSVAATTLPTEIEDSMVLSGPVLSPDGSLAALNRTAGNISIWNRKERRVQCTLSNVQGGWTKPVFSPDNHYLAVCSPAGRTVRLFYTETGEVWKEWEIGEEGVQEVCAFAFSWDSRLLAAGHTGFAVTLWDVQTGERKQLLWVHRDGVSALAFSPDARLLAVGTYYEETVWLWSLTPGGKNVPLIGHTDNIRSADFSPDGTRIATGAQDGTVRLWEPSTGKLLATFVALPKEEWVVYTPAGEYTGSPGAEKYLLWRKGEDLVPVTRDEPGEP